MKYHYIHEITKSNEMIIDYMPIGGMISNSLIREIQ